MTTELRQDARRICAEIEASIGALKAIENRLVNHAVELGMLANDYERRIAARPLIEPHTLDEPMRRAQLEAAGMDAVSVEEIIRRERGSNVVSLAKRNEVHNARED